MFNRFLLFFAITFLTVNAFGQEPTKVKLEGDLKVFANRVTKAANAHDASAMLMLMDPQYRKEQHDGMLEGRTEQFINEFFCGNIIKSKDSQSNFGCPGFNKISKVKIKHVFPHEHGYQFQMEFRAGKTVYTSTYFVRIRNTKQGVGYGLVGAVG